MVRGIADFGFITVPERIGPAAFLSGTLHMPSAIAGSAVQSVKVFAGAMRERPRPAKLPFPRMRHDFHAQTGFPQQGAMEIK